MTLSTAAIVRRLRAAGCVFAEDEAALLVAEAGSSDELDAMVDRRVSGLPLEHILGWAEFAGLRISVDPGVFVPRRRTEFLARRAIDFARESAGSVVVDLCCGAGAIAAAVIAAVPNAVVYASDIDSVAVQSARRNLPAGQVFEGDLFDALPESLRGTISVLVANTPYVPSDAISLMPPEARLHEQRLALDGGSDGLDVQRRVAELAVGWMRPGGRLLVEASEEQAPETAAIFERHGMSATVESSEELYATIVVGRFDIS